MYRCRWCGREIKFRRKFLGDVFPIHPREDEETPTEKVELPLAEARKRRKEVEDLCAELSALEIQRKALRQWVARFCCTREAAHHLLFNPPTPQVPSEEGEAHLLYRRMREFVSMGPEEWELAFRHHDIHATLKPALEELVEEVFKAKELLQSARTVQNAEGWSSPGRKGGRLLNVFEREIYGDGEACNRSDARRVKPMREEYERAQDAYERERRCPGCDYDLRGDLASSCPHCGWRRNAD